MPNMDFLDEYAKWTAETALYPGAGTGSAEAIVYLTIGLMAEVGERDITFMPSDVVDELGDILWYCARLAVENGDSFAKLYADSEEYDFSAGCLKSDIAEAQVEALGAIQKHLRGKRGVDVAMYSQKYLFYILCRIYERDRGLIERATLRNVEKLRKRLKEGKILRAPSEA